MSRQHWIIYGNNPSSWSAALFLQHQISPAEIQITLVVPSSVDDRGLVLHESTQHFHKLIGLNEKEFLTQTGAAIYLAHQFLNWSEASQDILISNSQYGKMHERIDFFHWLHKSQLGDAVSAEQCNLNILAARQQRFAPPPPAAPEIFQELKFGYQVNSRAYCAYLEDVAKQRGLTILHVQEITQHPSSGHVVEVDVFRNDGEKTSLVCDYFVNTLPTIRSGDTWVSAEGFIPESVGVTQVVPKASASLVAGVEKTQTGWRKRVVTQTETIETEFRPASDGVDGVGYCRKPWQGAQINLGDALANIGTCYFDSFALTQRALVHLATLFPYVSSAKKMAEFNRLTYENCERVLDIHNFLFWCSGLVKNTTLSLTQRLELFLSQGFSVQTDRDFISDSCWQLLLASLYRWPDGFPRGLSLHPDETHKEMLSQRSKHLNQAVNAMPPYVNLLAYLAREAKHL